MHSIDAIFKRLAARAVLCRTEWTMPEILCAVSIVQSQLQMCSKWNVFDFGKTDNTHQAKLARFSFLSAIDLDTIHDNHTSIDEYLLWYLCVPTLGATSQALVVCLYDDISDLGMCRIEDYRIVPVPSRIRATTPVTMIDLEAMRLTSS